ncbi:Tetratricopeptide repeat protein [Aquisphaera giovannonii]|uniref:Tetratricopeptide repeat protein n=1 Tax=Aquisphaera giovannonii TaxID=406548 RepID=A0A5B9WEF2_9BACT|nr:tetratricopeptide repeat protein [Aquisphaera giovannonii]QEH38341.1 Tetratricopeptide repeat protein [Aquisphaera giovannonii]
MNGAEPGPPGGPRVPMVVLSCLVVGLGVAAVYLLWSGSARPRATVSGIVPMLTAGRFDDAEARLREILRADPDHIEANMLMAQAALVRPDPKPELALRHLPRVRTSRRDARAVVRLYEGKARAELGRNDLAEALWLEALRIDPAVPEAGWNLLGLYQVQGRREDAHRLAMELFRREPDPRDRVQLLMELLRQDAQPIGTDSLIQTLEPIVAAHPEDPQAAIALARAYLKNSRPGDGLPLLGRVLDRSPDNPYAWDTLLAGLDDTASAEEFARCLARIPPAIAGDPRFLKHRGSAALKGRDWPLAVDWLRRANASDPSDGQVLYRLCQALKVARRSEELGPMEERFRAFRDARERVQPLYKEANAVPDLGVAPHPELCRRLADLREDLGRADEAEAWRRFAAEGRPSPAPAGSDADRRGIGMVR